MMIRPIDEIWLEQGKHSNPEQGMCAMEAVAWLNGETHSDMPRCACTLLASWLIVFNDWTDDMTRQRLKPLLPYMIGTANDGLKKARKDLLYQPSHLAWINAAVGDLRGVIDMIDPLGERTDQLERVVGLHGRRKIHLQRIALSAQFCYSNA